MAKIKFEHSKPHVNIGTIGHASHGKTTLTAAVAEVLCDKYPDLNEFRPFDQTDNAPEERGRGITTNVSYIEYQIGRRHCAHADTPGHAGCVKNMITNMTQVDGAVPVAVATGDPVARTRGHTLFARQVDIPTILVTLSESSVVDNEEVFELVEKEYRGLLESQDFDRGAPITKVSVLKTPKGGEGWVEKIVEFVDAVDELIPTPEYDMDKPFLMPIEDIFTVIGRGAVVTDRVEHGKFPINSRVGILGICDPQKVTVTGIEMFHKSTDETWVDEDCDLLLRGTKRDEVRRGRVVAVPGSIVPHANFTGQVYILKKEEGGRHNPFFSSYRSQSYFCTTGVTGVTTLPEGTDMVIPGDTTEITIELIQPIAMKPGLSLAIREGSRTVGSGRVTTIGRWSSPTE